MTRRSESPGKESLDRLREAAALLLWEYEAVVVRPDHPFRLASGNHSPIYVNCRRAISEPTLMALFSTTARLLSERRGIRSDVIAGGETAGIPFAAFLASSLARPMVYVRKQPKGHGIASRVEGHLAQGASVLLVEDLITDGGSKLGFLDAIEEAGGRVRDVLVLFDRRQGGAALLAERGVRLHAVTDRDTVLAAGESAGVLSQSARRAVDAYFRDPAVWHRERDLEYRKT
ncbi:MAG: orotate phosphoribosyltransferase [bacterium]|nr:orotate phosphoribosyltransferase [bacterium]